MSLLLDVCGVTPCTKTGLGRWIMERHSQMCVCRQRYVLYNDLLNRVWQKFRLALPLLWNSSRTSCEDPCTTTTTT